jgi:hypothetical protein
MNMKQLPHGATLGSSIGSTCLFNFLEFSRSRRLQGVALHICANLPLVVWFARGGVIERGYRARADNFG